MFCGANNPLAGKGEPGKFNFKYDDFKIDLNKIDSIQISVPKIPIERDDYGNEKLVKIKTVIQNIKDDFNDYQKDNSRRDDLSLFGFSIA